MNSSLQSALAKGGLIDLTTTGRRTGQARRIEIVFHVIDGRILISGMPRREKRAWLANIEADPHVTIHLKRDVVATSPRRRALSATSTSVDGSWRTSPAPGAERTSTR